MLSPVDDLWCFSPKPSCPQESSEKPSTGTGAQPSSAEPTPQSLQPKRAWTLEEEETLVEWVRNHGSEHWRGVTDMFKNRTFRECREHWRFNYSQLGRRPWTAEEDATVIECHQKLGNQWRMISGFLQDRTENAVKNRWRSALRVRRTEPFQAHVTAYSHKERPAPLPIPMPMLCPMPEARVPAPEAVQPCLFPDPVGTIGISDADDTLLMDIPPFDAFAEDDFDAPIF
jgi:hypothetical protein